MKRITQEQDGSYRWDCPIDTDHHQKSGKKALAGVLILCAFVIVLFLITTHGTGARDDIWIPLLVTGVILVIALPLLILWNSAGDPHEQYVLTGDYVKSGYGKSSIFSVFRNTKEAVFTANYIEMIGKHQKDRIYVPTGDMDFVREFILERLPDDAVIRYM